MNGLSQVFIVANVKAIACASVCVYGRRKNALFHESIWQPMASYSRIAQDSLAWNVELMSMSEDSFPVAFS